MRRTGKYDNDVDVAGIVAAPVAAHDLGIGPWREVVARPRGKLLIILDRGDAAVLAEDFGQHGTVVAGAGADLQHVLATPQLQVIEIPGPQARRAVVEAARGIDGHQYVVIEPCRI